MVLKEDSDRKSCQRARKINIAMTCIVIEIFIHKTHASVLQRSSR